MGLEIEPGRFLVAESGVLLGNVRATKNAGSNHFVLVDTGFNELMRPSMYGSYHGMSVLRRDGSRLPAQRQRGGRPAVRIGRRVHPGRRRRGAAARPGLRRRWAICWSFTTRGLMARSMSTNYNTRPLAAEVLVDGAEHRLIRRRQTVEELLALELGL